MNRKDYQQVKQIFQSVLEVTADERADYLDKACDGDDVLRGEVERLLNSFDSGYLENPAIGKVAELIVGSELEVGREIGHYKIVKKIGAGGMGEVYLAEDIKLDRRVALKILPQEFAEDTNRMSRFVREAKSASSLNHPNIITIHEIGEADGKHFIATEYIEGETLRDKLNSEKLSVKSTLEISVQIASALQAAHAAGIIHRDIKPENVMIRPDGLIKILDFGIAKLSEPPATTSRLSLDEEAATAIKAETTPGMIIGTANYMSPEQARGQLVDSRSDIFSFGVVLYEMLTGKRAFAGETAMDAIGAILHKKPISVNQLLPEIPHEIERIINKTLRKDRDERYQTAKDLLIDLKDAKQDLEFQDKLENTTPPHQEEPKTQLMNAPTGGVPQPTSSAEYIVGSVKRHKTGAIAAFVLFAVVLTGIGYYGIYKLTAKQDKPVPSFQTAKIARLTTTGKASGVGISPDGKFVAHVQIEGGHQSLWVRQVVAQSNVQIVAPAAVFYADSMTFSPDGNYVYYNITSQDYPQRALFQVSTLGGAPKKLLENVQASPITFSPDGKQFAFNRTDPGKESALMIANADGTNERRLIAYKNPPDQIIAPAWSPDGKRIAYVLANFDSNDHTIFEAQVADGVTKPLTRQRWFRVTRLTWLADGSGLLMLAATEQQFIFQIWHLSYPEGEAHRLTNELNDYRGMSLAADSNTLAVVESERQGSIWVAPVGDVSRARPVTSGSGKADNSPAWTPDGRIVYHSNASGTPDIWITDADGGSPKQLTANARINQGPVVSPDGRYIVFHSDRTGVPHLWRMNLDGSDQRQLTNGASGEQSAQFSPDGRWIVYSTSFGKQTIWKMPADGGEPVQLTDKISRVPTVSPDGKLVAYFYQDENSPWRVAVAPLDGGAPLRTYDIEGAPLDLNWTPDGRAIAYTNTRSGVSNIFAQPIDGGARKQLTDFKTDSIFSFAFSPDGKQLALSRGTVSSDVVLISNFK